MPRLLTKHPVFLKPYRINYINLSFNPFSMSFPLPSLFSSYLGVESHTLFTPQQPSLIQIPFTLEQKGLTDKQIPAYNFSTILFKSVKNQSQPWLHTLHDKTWDIRPQSTPYREVYS